MAFLLNAAACSNKGCVRRNNEDNFCLNGKYLQRSERDNGGRAAVQLREKALFAVCDGMGGEEAGEEASLLPVQLCDAYRESMSTDPKDLLSFFHKGCVEVLAQAEANENHSGSTVALLVADEEGLHAANMGDSRIYRLTNRALEQISEDHTEVQRLLKKGAITRKEMKTHPKRHMILQYWGMPLSIAPFKPFISRLIPYVHAEKYLLCSDGLTDMVEDSRIEQILRQKKPADILAQELIDEAIKNGGRDNVTALVVEVVSEEILDEATEDSPVQISAVPDKSPKRFWLTALLVLLAADVCTFAYWLYLLLR